MTHLKMIIIEDLLLILNWIHDNKKWISLDTEQRIALIESVLSILFYKSCITI